ncbi:hypothetical protein C8Q73DRAFT_364789 [Cubamyces lactineus]|nr:hypothetical protein C8Q73DRAFT_364789 [Cubamyces lactineus]
MVRTSSGWRRALAFTAVYALGVFSSDVLVDDADSRIRYSPSVHWSQGASCGNCALHPSPSEVQDGTWHDTTFEPESETGPFSASFTFTGVGVKVYAILPADSANNPQVQTTHTDVIFLLDNVNQERPYQYDPPVGADFQYRQLIFDSGTVVHGDHTLTIQLSEDVTSVLLLDYLIYTVPDATTSSLVPPTASVASVDSAITPSKTTTKSQSTQAVISSTSSPPIEQSTSPLVQSATTSLPRGMFSSTTRTPGPSTGSSDILSPSNTQNFPPPSSLASSFALTPSSTTNNTHDEPIATDESTESTTNSIPATTVIAAAVAGSIALLILLAVVIYLLCIRHARKHLVAGGDHAGLPGDDDQQHFTEITGELYPSLATQARLLGHTRNPFVDPGVQRPPHADTVIAEPTNLSLSLPGADSAATRASGDDNDSELLPTPRSSIQSMVTAHESPAASLPAPARPDSRPTTLVDHNHLDPASDKLSMEGGSESDDGSGAPCSAPASTLPDLPTCPVFAHVDTAPVPNAPSHNSYLIADARVLEQLAALKDEVARIRARQEALPAEAPPRYDEVR